MRYEDDDFTDPWRAPDVETIVLQHGNAKSAKMWHAWVPLLANDYRVVRLNARGFGGSSAPPPGHQWSARELATDMANLLDHLGIERAHVIGETFGTAIAIEFAYRFPERTRSLSVCSIEYRGVGIQRYKDMHTLVEREGVEAWVRQQGARYGRPEWYMQEMMKTDQQV